MHDILDRRSDRDAAYCMLICAKDPAARLLMAAIAALRREIEGHLILLDDGSDDISYFDLVRPMVDVLIVLPVHAGIPRAANIGLDFCIRSGYRICFRSDADDLTQHGRFAETLSLFARDENCILVGGMANDIDPGGKTIRRYGTPGHFRKGDRRFLYPVSPARHSTFAIHLARTQGRLRYNEAYRLAQDYCMLFDAAAIGNVAISRLIFTDYRTGATTISQRKRRSQLLFRGRLFLEKGDWLLPQHYAALLILLMSFLLPERLRGAAGRTLSFLLGRWRP